jgi:hypothetical protein
MKLTLTIYTQNSLNIKKPSYDIFNVLSSSFSEMSIQNISNIACGGYQSVELSR